MFLEKVAIVGVGSSCENRTAPIKMCYLAGRMKLFEVSNIITFEHITPGISLINKEITTEVSTV